MREIYLDHAATTPVEPRVLEKMLPYFGETFGNPSSLHGYGRAGARALDGARDAVAAYIGAAPAEVYFTSGGTEADNWAVRGCAHALAEKGRHIVIGASEHHAVLAAADILRAEGFSVSVAPVNGEGVTDLAALERSFRPDTVLAAVMTANNETGVLQPVRRIADLCHARGILFFTDAVQAAGALSVDVKDSGADMLSLSAHKFYGPKGSGALYVRAGLKLHKLIAGGQQERGMRGGTDNVPGAVGMAEALRLACAERAQNAAYVSRLRDRFEERVLRGVENVLVNGGGAARLPSVSNLSFEGVDGEQLLYALDLQGVAASAGAACASGSVEPSHVLAAMGMPAARARGGVRFSFGKDNAAEEADAAADIVKECVEGLRRARRA